MTSANPEISILVVEDDRAQRELVASILGSAGYRVQTESDARSALATLAKRNFDLVISDWQLGDGLDGTTILAWLNERERDESFIIVTAYGTVEHAVTAIKTGADDYLAKPFARASLLLSVERTLKARRLADENRRLALAIGERDRLVDLVGSAPMMQKVYRQIERVAKTQAGVLFTGESGTGKELAARALHKLSTRADRPLVVVNCAAIPGALAEAEFFGARAGAFTDAKKDRRGVFEAAEGGTLFLDEIGELPLDLQPKLLRVLQEKRYTPVGDTTEKIADVRIVAATNRALEDAVAEGRFRSDLFFRLNVIAITMPPLRERREDLPMLIDFFIDRSARIHGLARPTCPTDVKKHLLDHTWPGNVRELANTIERLVLLSDGEKLAVNDLPNTTSPAPALGADFQLPPEGIAWDALEKSLFAQAIQMAGGNKKRAAALLGLPYRTFLYRIETRGPDTTP